ncbi:serine-rich coiled-coil domain-containing protein 2 [Neosynchiropus ocellatus]
MEDKSSIKSAMVSRLPKFGGRSSGGGSAPASNCSAQQPASAAQDSKATPSASRPNGVIRSSPFSLKWKKNEGTTGPSPSAPTSPGDACEDKTQLPTMAKEAKSTTPGTPKVRRSGPLTVAVSSPKTIHKQTPISPKVGGKFSQSPLNGGPKIGSNSTLNGSRTGSETRLVRPRPSSSSPRSSSQDSLSQSSESLKNLALDNMVRSNSFTHFKQIPSPSSQPMTRSFSFNRAVELAKPLANTQLQPPRGSFLKPPQLSNGRVGAVLDGGHLGSGSAVGGRQYSRATLSTSSLPTLSIPSAPSTPSALKKPLLPSCVFNKSLGTSGGGLSFRLARGQVKQQKPVLPGQVKGEVGQALASDCGGLLGIAVDIALITDADKAISPSDSDGSSGDGGARDGGNSAPSSGLTAAETLEDMSLSSASSLDKGDTSEEFQDDFDNGADIFSDGEAHDDRKTAGETATRLQNFLSATMDCVTVDLTGKRKRHRNIFVMVNLTLPFSKGHNDESPMEDSQGPLVMSPDRGDVCQASSLELSPSNSSGGTYMWDEEGLEPLGGAVVLPCDTYDDSELNSVDILNNLDAPSNGELDDDDLMLDVDLPEDGTHDFAAMSQSERGRRPGQRRKHHRWSGPENFYNESRALFFPHYDAHKFSRISSQPVLSESRHQGLAVTLDELTLDHMNQDCSTLKKQLLKLKSLLQLEDTDAPADVAEEIEDNTSSASRQLEEMIKEVQTLREEVRSRDKTIVQLTLQCQQLQQQNQREQMHSQGQGVRCQCHHQRAPSTLGQADKQANKRMQPHCDKATQTYWRSPSHAPHILQPFNPQCLSERFHPERLVSCLPTEGHNDLALNSAVGGAISDESLEGFMAEACSRADPNELSHQLSTHLQWRSAGTRQKVTVRDAEGSASHNRPRMLQPPRLHQRVSLPALKPGGMGGAPSPGSPPGQFANRTKQLPPPSRGLPCFNAGPQLQLPCQSRPSLLQPRRAAELFRNSRSTSAEDPNQPGFIGNGSTKTAPSLRHTGLPKPKIH